MQITIGKEFMPARREPPSIKTEITKAQLDKAEKTISGLHGKSPIYAAFMNESALVRSYAVSQLGEVCFEEKEGATPADYKFFANALFEDPSFIVGIAAVKALAKTEEPNAVALLVQAGGCDVAQVRDEAHKAIAMLLEKERQMVKSGQRKKPVVADIVKGAYNEMSYGMKEIFYNNKLPRSGFYCD